MGALEIEIGNERTFLCTLRDATRICGVTVVALMLFGKTCDATSARCTIRAGSKLAVPLHIVNSHVKCLSAYYLLFITNLIFISIYILNNNVMEYSRQDIQIT